MTAAGPREGCGIWTSLRRIVYLKVSQRGADEQLPFAKPTKLPFHTESTATYFFGNGRDPTVRPHVECQLCVSIWQHN